jgi:hypothetical protein
MRAGTEGADAGARAGASAAQAQACRNCGAHATGHYCPNCGQETRIALPTFGTFMREAAGRYVALDGRAWRTLFALVARPGFLTLEYFNGRRRRYIRPARLFLVLYLLLFAIIGLIQSPADLGDEVVFVNSGKDGGTKGAPVDGAADAASKEAAAQLKEAAAQAKGALGEAREALAEAKRAGRADANGAPSPSAAGKPAAAAAADKAGLPKGVFDEEDDTLIGLDRDLNLTLRLNGADLPVPDRVRKRYDQFKKLSKEEKAERLYAGALRYGPYAMVVLLPAFALLLKLAYLGRAGRYPGRPSRYAEHLVYSAHLHAFAAIALIGFVLLSWPPVRLALVGWIFLYVMLARQRVYRGRWWAGLLRAFAIAIVYLVLVSFAIVGLLIMAVMLR